MSYVYSTEQRKQVERRSTSNGVGFSDLAGESERISVRKSPPHSSSSPSSTSGQSFPVGQATSGERKKYFTQKYGQHQMQLIRKRLAVEEWLDEKLRAMYSVVSLNKCNLYTPYYVYTLIYTYIYTCIQ